MDSGNVFELFSQAVNEGDIVQLDKISREIYRYLEKIYWSRAVFFIMRH